jgi:hypothetical protein
MEFEENVLNNDNYKVFFLKSILLGIKYGQSNNHEYYVNNIQQEINRTLNKKNNILLEKKVPKNNMIEKTENNLLQLDNQKNYTISLINNLSLNNYGYNYSRINLLRNNLLLIGREIEKNKLILKKNKELILQKENSEKVEIKEPSKNIFKKIYEPKIYEKIHESKNFKKNETKQLFSEHKDNFVGELEKTLGSLSNMII